jgi:PAS domain S-box-containing protein
LRREGFIERILSKGEKLSRAAIESILLEVAEERDHYQVIFDSLVEGVMATDSDGTCTFLNLPARRLLGIPEEQKPGFPVLSLLPTGRFQEAAENCLRTGERLLWEEVPTSFPIERILLLSIIPIRDRSKRHLGTVFIFYDVTQKKESERELARTQRLAEMTTLAARLSHEIRNPLNNLNIYTQLAERDLRLIGKDTGKAGKLSEQAREHLKIVREEIDRLNNALEDFLTAVRPTKPILTEVNVYDLIEGTLRLLRPELESRRAKVTFESHCGEGVTILADGGQLRRAVLNLIKNAAEAIAEDGTIGISLDVEDADLVIRVKDNGTGIPEELHERIFEPYFSTKEDGTGLGLVTVKQVVEDHGGTISVDSRAGDGAKFEVRVPRRRDRHRLLPLHESPSRGTPDERKNRMETRDDGHSDRG